MTIVNYDDLMTPLMMCTKKGITHVKNNFLVYFLWTPQIAKRPIKSDTDEYQQHAALVAAVKMTAQQL